MSEREWKPRTVTEDGREIYVLSDMPVEGGKTLREANMEKPHELQLGDLVEVEVNLRHRAYGDSGEEGVRVDLSGTCVLVVNFLGRDCDGTPLYGISDVPVHRPRAFSPEWLKLNAISKFNDFGYSIEALKPVGRRVRMYDSVGEFMGIFR